MVNKQTEQRVPLPTPGGFLGRQEWEHVLTWFVEQKVVQNV